MITQELEQLPIGTEFQKLTNNGEPYYLTRPNDNGKLRYKFWSQDKKVENKKFIIIKEFLCLLEIGLNKPDLTIMRNDFEIHCPRSKASGPCGFCIMVRLIENLKIGKYSGNGVEITDPIRLAELLNEIVPFGLGG